MRKLLLVALLGACDPNEPVCGDGVVYDDINDPRFEECDDGNAIADDGCSSCTVDVASLCGDGIVQFGEACDDGNVVSGDGCSSTCIDEPTFDLTASWSFQTIASNQITACPANFDTMRAVTQKIDMNGNLVGPPIIDLFTCSTSTGTAQFVPARYRTFLEATNSAGTLVYAQSVPAIVDLRAANGTLATTFANDGGYFGFAWTLRGATSNSLLTCAQASASSASLIATVASSTTSSEDLFECGEGAGVTAALLAGTYTISVSALDGAMQSVGTAPTQTNKAIQAPNKVTDLGTVTIPITGL